MQSPRMNVSVHLKRVWRRMYAVECILRCAWFPALVHRRRGANERPPRAIFGNTGESRDTSATHPGRYAPSTEAPKGEKK